MIKAEPNFGWEARITVVGIGGCGNNTINQLVDAGIKDVCFVGMNTDAKVINKCKADYRLHLGDNPHGCGGRPFVGMEAANSCRDEIAQLISGSKMVFIAAGMGGGTGTGGAPVVAQVAREMGILTLAVVTMPFSFEGSRRNENAKWGLKELYKAADTVVVIPNDALTEKFGKDLTLVKGLRLSDEVLFKGVVGITDIILKSDEINLDFNDVERVLRQDGLALMGIGYGKGKAKIYDAVNEAIYSPLLDDLSLEGAKALLLHFASGVDLNAGQISHISTQASKVLAPDAEVFFGLRTDPELKDDVKVTIIAKGVSRIPGTRKVCTKVYKSLAELQPIEQLEKEMKSADLNDYSVPTIMRQRYKLQLMVR